MQEAHPATPPHLVAIAKITIFRLLLPFIAFILLANSLLSFG